MPKQGTEERELVNVSSIDREVELLTAKVTCLSEDDTKKRDELRKQIALLQRRRVEITEPRAFRDVAASFG